MYVFIVMCWYYERIRLNGDIFFKKYLQLVSWLNRLSEFSQQAEHYYSKKN